MKSRENNLKCKIIYLIYDICCRLKMRIGCRTVLLKLSTKIITVLKKRFMRSYSTNTCTKHICQSFFPDLFFIFSHAGPIPDLFFYSYPSYCFFYSNKTFYLFSCWSYSRSIFYSYPSYCFFYSNKTFYIFYHTGSIPDLFFYSYPSYCFFLLEQDFLHFLSYWSYSRSIFLQLSQLLFFFYSNKTFYIFYHTGF